MPLPESGSISLADVAAEFGGVAPHSMDEYYGEDGTPSSGVLSLDDFHGKSAAPAGTLMTPGMDSYIVKEITYYSTGYISLNFPGNSEIGAVSPSPLLHNGKEVVRLFLYDTTVYPAPYLMVSISGGQAGEWTALDVGGVTMYSANGAYSYTDDIGHWVFTNNTPLNFPIVEGVPVQVSFT